MSYSALWPVLWAVGKVGKYMQRPYRWVIDGPQAVGKTTFWRLLKARLNPVDHLRRVPTDSPRKAKTYRIMLEDADRTRVKIRGADYPHSPTMTAQQIYSIWPTDVTLVIDIETCFRGQNIRPDEKLDMDELLQQKWRPTPPHQDPIVDHIQAILSGLASEYYRRNTAEWGTIPWPGTILPWKWLHRDGWSGINLRGSRQLTDFHLFFNKVDMIPQDSREELLKPIMSYYGKYLFGTGNKPTYLAYLMEEEEVRYHCLGTCLSKNWFIPYEEIDGMHFPMAQFMMKLVRDKEA